MSVFSPAVFSILRRLKNFDMTLINRLQVTLLFIFIFTAQVFGQVTIIPKPSELMLPPARDSFMIDARTVLHLDNAKGRPTASYFANYLKEMYGLSLKTVRKPVTGKTVTMKLAAEPGVSGAYKLDIGREGITLSGADEAGLFHGMQTLLQLMPTDKSTSFGIPSLTVIDTPRYQYRGMMLDVARHFMPVSVVKRFIDQLALHKMNVMHWHLTEDQGWRIEIKKHPRLTEAGAFRNGTIVGHHPGERNDNTRHGGYYTQKEIRDVVQYAAQRYITIVPEIEMPGHASAAIAAYPNLSCFPGEPTDLGKHPSEESKKMGGKRVQETWGVFRDVFCAGNDSTFALLQDVIDEVVTLFPSKYIHVGGDECPKDNWKRCPRCQQRIRDLGLKDEHELQSYFIQRMEKHINARGKTLIGWDEILEGGLAPNAVVMSWRGEQGGIEAARQKHEVIMTPNTYVYFDYLQGQRSMEPLGIGGYLPLQKVYSYEPDPADLTAEEARYIKGVQANLWTEYVEDSAKIDYMAMPRLAALSEVAWSRKGSKNWDDFRQRMEQQYDRYSFWGINASRSAYNVQQKVLIDQVRGVANVSFATDAHDPRIHYTLDGSEPGVGSPQYKGPFDIRRTSTIKAVVLKDGKPVGKTSVQQVVLE